MENSIYLALSKQLVLQRNMDVVANNIANMGTSGYRGQNLMFEEYLDGKRGDVAPRGADDQLSFVYDRGQYQTTAQGSLRQTGNPLDMALVGDGFIAVDAPNGEKMYTRSGEMQMAADGTLLSSAGMTMAGGIKIPPGSSEVIIDERGVISNQEGQIGQLEIVEFENLQDMEPFGDNMYRALNAPTAAQNTRVKQGMVEGSNVNPVLEMTKMIETLRAFQTNQNILQTENDRLRTAIQKLTRQG